MEKNLIVFYSYTDNTRKLAQLIHEKIGGDIVEIETVTPYSNDYNMVVNQGNEEVKRRYKPPIQLIKVDMNQYDTVFLGTPVWWYTVAPAVLTFLTENNLAGKKVIPFATNGGWLGNTFEDIKKLCPNAKVEGEMDIRYSGKNMRTSMKDIEKWIKSL